MVIIVKVIIIFNQLVELIVASIKGVIG